MTSREALQELLLKYNIPRHILEPLRLLDKRDTPMIPIKLKWKNTENYYYVCPKCEELVARTDEVFCQDCGQRLDWSESI